MRAPVSLLLLASAVLATPSIRWIDRAGNVQTRAIRGVVEAAPKEITVRLEDGRLQKVPVSHLLGLVRERAEEPRERALLHARQDVFAGVRLKAARPVLDRVLDSDAPTWMHEYAGAARAVLAERLAEKDAPQRIAAFLEKHPHSLLAPHVILARARREARREKDPQRALARYDAAAKEIRARHGSRLLELRAYIEGMRYIAKADPASMEELLGNLSERVIESMADPDDAGEYVIVDSSFGWCKLVFHQGRRESLAAKGQGLAVPLAAVRKLKLRSGLLLPEYRCDVLLELARLLAATGHPDEARAALKTAAAAAPGRIRKEAVAAALAALPDE